MSNPFQSFTIIPDYRLGMSFNWQIENTFAAPLPWKFQVEGAELPVGAPWLPLGQEAANTVSLRADALRLPTSAPMQFYRVRMTTPTSVFYSDICSPMQKLTRQEWCIIRTMMRDAALQYKGPGGSPLEVWHRALYGDACACSNAVTGESEDSGCTKCFGTGKALGYVGPVTIDGRISEKTRHTRPGEEEAATEASQRVLDMAANVALRSRDVIVNRSTGDRFVVGAVQHAAEIRGVPVLFRVTLARPAASDPIYAIGSAA